MKRFIVHVYPQRPCDFPHESFIGDYKELMRRNPSEEELYVFINSHSNEFLRAMIAKVPALLDIFLTMDPNRHAHKGIYVRTFARHFDNLVNRRHAEQGNKL